MNERRAIINIKGATKRFGAVVTAVDDVSLDIFEGEFFALLGPSGCGKTTLLRMLAGLETLTEGQMFIDGQDMAGIEPNHRPVNMVFQSYAVFPHMSVLDNVAYGLKVTGVAKNEIADRVEEALGLVKLEGYGDRKPDQLSGGQRQRVALARALVKRPKVLLLDEPLSALDAKLREAMQLELAHLQHSVGITFVIVTHDQDEALSMADRAAVMDHGKVLQIAAPADLYEYPNCRFVADFIGKMNLFEADVVGTEAGKLMVQVAGANSVGRWSLPYDRDAKGKIGVAIRPEKVRLEKHEPGDGRIKLKGTVREVAYYGNESHIYLDNPTGVMITANIQNEARDTRTSVAIDDELWISWNTADTLVLAE